MSRPHMSTETFINNLLEYWPDCPYDLSLVDYTNAQTKIKLICNVHGEFEKWTSEIRQRKMCPKCAPKKGVKKGYKQSPEHLANRLSKINPKRGHIAHNRLTTETFINNLVNVWPDCPYEISHIEYAGSNKKVLLTCNVHGEFEKWPMDLLHKSGCPKCSGFGYSPNEYLENLQKLRPEYDFTKSIYVNAKSKLKVRCKKHNLIFNGTRNAFVSSNKRCPRCTTEETLKNRILNGRAKDPELMTKWELYKRNVWKITNRTYNKHKADLGDRNFNNHLDHIYSILHGFNDSVEPEVIGSICNLRIISGTKNRKKNVDSDILLEDLIKLYKERKI